MPKRPAMNVLALATLIATITCPVAGAVVGAAQQEEETLEEAFASWRLKATVGVLSDALKVELQELVIRSRIAVAQDPTDNGIPLTIGVAIAQLQRDLAEAPSNDGTQEGTPAEFTNKDMVTAVRKALQNGDAKFFERIGVRAVPTLEQLSLQMSGEPLLPPELHALEQLRSIDAAAAMNVGYKLIGSKNFLVKREALEMLSGAFFENSLYAREGVSNWSLKNPKWLEMPSLALQDPAVEAQAVRAQLMGLANRGLLAKEHGDLAFELATERVPQQRVIPESGLWFIERLLQHPDDEVRSYAIRALASAGRIEAAFGASTDEARDVREDLADRLLMNSVYRYIEPKNLGAKQELEFTDSTPKLFEVYARLACDTTSAVRSVLENSMRARREEASKEPFSCDQYRSLLPRLPSVSALEFVLDGVKFLPKEERKPLVMDVLAELNSREGVTERQLQSCLWKAIKVESIGLSVKDDFWDIANASSEIQNAVEWSGGSIRSEATRHIAAGTLPATQFFGWLDSLGIHSFWKFEDTTPERQTLAPWFEALDPAKRARAIIGFIGSAKRGSVSRRELQGHGLVQDAAVLRSVFENEAVPAAARLWAVHELISEHPDTLNEDMVGPIADALAELPIDSSPSTTFRQRNFEPLHEPILGALLMRKDVEESILKRLSAENLSDATLDALLARFPVKSWPDIQPGDLLFSAAIEALVIRSRDALDPRLVVSDLHQTTLRSRAAAVISEMRTPALFPVAKDLLDASTVDSLAWNRAVDAVAGYFNAQAANVLLEEAKETTDARARQRIMSALRSITEWRETAAAWEKSDGAEAKRAKAIADLIGILENASASLEARAAAMRGLGVLGAAEELPRIIGALASEEPEIQAAAHTALARIERE